MKETKFHLPQVISEVVEVLEVFPNLTFVQVKEMFNSHYTLDDVNLTKFNNSLRFGYWKFHSFTNNLSYS